jgi:elongation factor Ts
MAEITAALVKDLREKTGAGMMDCKKALTETSGDIESAVDWLRKKGLSQAAKKAGRVAAEGLIGVATKGNRGAMIEINAETDFVARNDSFQDLVRKTTEIAVASGDDVEKIKSAAYPDGGTVADKLTSLIATIGENMSLRRAINLSVGSGVVTSYVHSATAPGLGKIGVLVALESTGNAEKLTALGKDLAMHIAAANPMSVSVAELDAAAIERERNVLTEQAKSSGRPDNVIAKMVEGRLRKFYEDVVLLEQPFVKDPDSRVSAVVEKAGKEIGAPVKVAAFRRFALGEGIERAANDFAAEVAAQAQLGR